MIWANRTTLFRTYERKSIGLFQFSTFLPIVVNKGIYVRAAFYRIQAIC